jgi:hypothetical protein
MTHQQNSHRHHYLPQFYLRAWGGPARSVWAFFEPRPGEPISKPYAPKSVGYEDGLYVAADLVRHECTSDAIEAPFLRDIDTAAAPVHRKLLAGDVDLSDEERLAWARFLHALHERNPSVLAQQQPVAENVISATLASAWRLGPARSSSFTPSTSQ